MHPEMSEGTRRIAGVLTPLSDADRRSALEAARKALEGKLSDRHFFLGADLRIEKPKDPAAPPVRQIAVLVLDHERRSTFEVLVNSAGEVAQVTDLGGFQPPFQAGEVREAREIAEREPLIAGLARQQGSYVNLFVPHSEGLAGHRLVGLRYSASSGASDNQGRRLLAEVVVDLSRRKLIRYEDMESSAEGRER